MKKLILITLLALFALPSLSEAGRVKGHWRDTNRDGMKGTYVQPHSRTNPNSSRTDNYSYPGNYNPNKGTVTPPSNSPKKLYPTNPNPYDTGTTKGRFHY